MPRTAGGSQPRAWLPVPAVPRSHAVPQKSEANLASAGIWLPLEETSAERLFMIILTVGALIGIGYGFSLLLDLVEGWASFQAGIGGLLQ